MDSLAAGDHKLQNYQLKNHHSKVDLAGMAKLHQKRLSTQGLKQQSRSTAKRFSTMEPEIRGMRKPTKQQKFLQSARVSLTDLNDPEQSTKASFGVREISIHSIHHPKY